MTPPASGAEILARTLERLGARHVFGLPGTQNVPTFDALRRSRLRTVTCVHELGAAFMANGYARASGEVGILATIPGPGFAYAIPGLAEARLDSVPVLHVTGQPPAGHGGRFLHQALPQERMVEGLVKGLIPVDRAAEMESAVTSAWEMALEGEPGPVVLHLGPSVQSEQVENAAHVEPTPASKPRGGHGELDEAVRRLTESVRPIVFLGQGAAGAADAVRLLVDRLGAPFFSTPSGRGVVPESHPACLRFDADRASPAVLNELLGQSDLVLAIGCRMGFNGTAGFALDMPASKLVHLNTDPETFTGPYPAGVGVVGRAEEVVPSLLERNDLAQRVPWLGDGARVWADRLRAERRSGPPDPAWHGVAGGAPAGFFAALEEALPDDGIVVTDSGLHQVLTRRHYTVRSPRGLVMPTDLQSMGFGVPAAIGARIAAPERPVVAVVGDGGFAMAGMELLTALREGVRVVVVVINDGYLNLIRMQQIANDGAPTSVQLENPDFRGLAEALGVGYALVDGDAVDTLRWSLNQRGPVLVEVLASDSPEISRLRATGTLRRAARRALGPRAIQRVKSILKRR